MFPHNLLLLLLWVLLFHLLFALEFARSYLTGRSRMIFLQSYPSDTITYRFPPVGGERNRNSKFVRRASTKPFDDYNIHHHKRTLSPKKMVGRKGYNTTLLSLCQYNFKMYHEQYERFQWELHLHYLREYKREHGHLYVPARYSVLVPAYYTPVNETNNSTTMSGSYPLHIGRWLHKIRKTFQDKPMRQRTITSHPYLKELDEMGMEWDNIGMGHRPGSFQEYLEELKVFRQRFGHVRIPRNYYTHANRSLGVWVHRQRSFYRRKLRLLPQNERITNTTSERLRLLTELDVELGIIGTEKNVSGHIHPENHHMTLSSNRWLYGKAARMQSYFDSQWLRTFERLRQYNITEGHCNVPFYYLRDLELGLWVMEQKREFFLLQRSDNVPTKASLSSLMTPSKYRLLSDIGFNFSSLSGSYLDRHIPCPWKDVAKLVFDVDKMILALDRFHQSYGHAFPDLNYSLTAASDEDVSLYSFVRRLQWESSHYISRLRYPKKVAWILNNQTILDKLIRMDFPFGRKMDSNTIAEKEYDWWDNFFDLLRYKCEHGDFYLQSEDAWYSEKIEQWFISQVQDYNDFALSLDDFAGNLLSERHYQALLDIGVSFNEDENFTWPHLSSPGRKPAVLYLEKYGSRDVRDDQKQQNVVKLGKRKELAQEWMWILRYNIVKKYVLTYGSHVLSANKLNEVDPSKQSYYWVQTQRAQYHRYLNGQTSTLSDKKMAMLDAIGFSWDRDDIEWSMMLQRLKLFKEKHGHCFVPPAYPLDRLLGHWVSKQRDLYHQSLCKPAKELLSDVYQQRVKVLMQLGLDLQLDNYTWGQMSFDVIWNVRFIELQNFKEKFGHCNVEVDYTSPHFDLALWVQEQRKLYNRMAEGFPSTLDANRINLLEELGFSWKLSLR